MSIRTSHPALPSRPQTVASIADHALLSHPFSDSESDVIELRLEALLPHITLAKETLLTLKNSPLKTLITARCATEGGKQELSIEQRTQLIMALSPLATYVDIELANYHAMNEAIQYAQGMNCLVIASFHNFKQTPSKSELNEKIAQAHALGADIVKIAIYHQQVDDLFRCAELLQENKTMPLSLMGMGPLAPSSRLLYAQLGSILNYGYLGDEATAPGQWPARLLHEAISMTTPF